MYRSWHCVCLCKLVPGAPSFCAATPGMEANGISTLQLLRLSFLLCISIHNPTATLTTHPTPNNIATIIMCATLLNRYATETTIASLSPLILAPSGFAFLRRTDSGGLARPPLGRCLAPLSVVSSAPLQPPSGKKNALSEMHRLGPDKASALAPRLRLRFAPPVRALRYAPSSVAPLPRGPFAQVHNAWARHISKSRFFPSSRQP